MVQFLMTDVHAVTIVDDSRLLLPHQLMQVTDHEWLAI